MQEIKAEAKALKKLTPYRIKKMDIEIFINLYCAYAKWIGDNLARFSEKYNYDIYGYRLDNPIGLNGYFDGNHVGVHFDTLFTYREIGIKELLLHELAHTKFHHHEVEFWNQLVFTLNEENLLFNDRIHVFKTETKISGERVLLDNGNLFGIYKKDTCKMESCSNLTMDLQYGTQANGRTVLAIVGKVLKRGSIRWLYRAELCENEKHMPLWPMWKRYMESYGLFDSKLKFDFYIKNYGRYT